MKFTILGAPRTKKNHMRIVRGKAGKPRLIQAASHDAWSEAAVLQLRTQGRPIISAIGAIIGPVNMRALVYRDRAGRADLLNYLAAISDALEAAGIVADDSLVAGVDGSRLLVDRANPRVEVELSPLTAEVAA